MIELSLLIETQFRALDASINNFKNSPNNAFGNKANTTPAPTAFRILLKNTLNLHVVYS